MKFKLFALVFIVLLAGAGCAANRYSARRAISGHREAGYLALDASYAKAVCDPRAGVVFALSKALQEVHIFRDGKRINSIGGLGFERTNFQRLSDIGIDKDGGLLALDSSQKLLRKFSAEGRVIGDLALPNLRLPELFCLSPDGNLFVYDATGAEIVCFSTLDGAEVYRFGRFELDQPANLGCNQDLLYAYSAATNATSVFYLLGQFKEKLPEQVAFDAYGNPVRMGDLAPADGTPQPNLMTINSGTACLLGAGYVRLVELLYEGGADAAQ